MSAIEESIREFTKFMDGIEEARQIDEGLRWSS
jgi:hypothetical protein